MRRATGLPACCLLLPPRTAYRLPPMKSYSRGMRNRTYPRTGWQVSEIGYGMWGMGGWTGSDDEQSLEALDVAIGLGCNFFDTAWAYGSGHSEELLGQTLQRHAGKRLYVATKVPPKNFVWPGKAETPIADVFPPDHIREYTEKSLHNLGIPDTRPAAAARLERCVGGRRRLEAGGRGPEAREADHQLRDQREPVGARERPQGTRIRARGQRAGRLQHLRPGPRGCAVPVLPAARDRHHRARAVRRRQPHGRRCAPT